MNRKHKLIAFLLILGVFAVGVAAGVFGERLVAHKHSMRQVKRGPTIEDMTRELKLSAEQQTAIREVFKRGDERFTVLRTELHKTMREMREMLRREIDAVLTEEQRAGMKELVKAYEPKGPADKGKDKKKDGEPDKSSRDRNKEQR